MHSPPILCKFSSIALGERPDKLDSAKSPLDLSRTRETSQIRAYPSPPMSNSPPPPPPLRRNSDFDDQGQVLGASSRNDPRALLSPQTETRNEYHPVASQGTYQPGPPVTQPYSYSHGGDSARTGQPQYQYPPIQQQLQQQPSQSVAPPEQQLGTMAVFSTSQPEHHDPFSNVDRGSVSGPLSHESPRAQRKTKGHVASACVPCKRAHLRCDAQRPCSRCLTNGKEEACVDVQHKKRGRPRLRDERETRYEGMGPAYPPPPDHAMRRPLSLYTASEPTMHDASTTSRAGSYRVLRLQSGPPTPARYVEHGSLSQANVYSSPLQSDRGPSTQGEPPCAYLNMDLQVSRASRSFCDAVGTQSVTARKLVDLLAINDRDKVYRLQRTLEEARQQREPNYLPPIYGRVEEDRVIQSIGTSIEEVSQFRTGWTENLNFQSPDGQTRNYQIRFGLAKKDSTYFVVLVILFPATPQGTSSSLTSPYSREPQYGSAPPQSGYSQPAAISPYGQYQPQSSFDQRSRDQPPIMGYRQPTPLGSNTGGPPPPSLVPSPLYPHTYPRPEYGAPANPREIPRSQIASQGQSGRSNELQLPPIRTSIPDAPRQDTLSGGGSGSASGRVDIGGLLEAPESQSRRS